MKPTVGRIVHYVARGSADGKFPPVHRAAVNAEVIPGAVHLVVLNPQGIFFDKVEYDENKAPGTWHWPERED